MAVRGDKLVNHIINDDTSLNLFNFVKKGNYKQQFVFIQIRIF